MDAKRLDDILQAREQQPDYKAILAKIVRSVADMKASLPAAFIKSVHELTKACNFKVALAPAPSCKSNAKRNQPSVSPSEPDPPQHMKVGDRSEPTPHGFY